MPEGHSKPSRGPMLVLIVWLVVALVVGRMRLLESVPRIVLQLTLLSLTFCCLLAFWKSRAVNNWVMSRPVRVLISFHVVRFVGIYFLVLYRRGELPFAFAVPGGIGDIAVAFMALLIGLFSVNDPPNRPLVLIWNTLGLLDILFVVITAARLGLKHADSMLALTHLPLSLLPTFFVPLIIASHLIIFYRLGRRGQSHA
ncbi:MAG: hypothetical protein JWR26_3625 [Pedosphaera sp.]|nr:hypothetical protein [Pedosphaera sp.]